MEMIEYADHKGVIENQFNTNATLLNEESAGRLIEAGLNIGQDNCFFRRV